MKAIFDNFFYDQAKFITLLNTIKEEN